jgi:hypothetical protein
MALSTPIDLRNRGLTANAGVVTTKYPHSQAVTDSPIKVVHAIFHGPDATTVKGAAIATSDVFPLIDIPAGAFVLGVAHKVLTAEGGTCTYGIGDGDTTSGYVAAANGNTTTNAFSMTCDATTPDLGNGKFYSAADSIDLILTSGTAATVVIGISVTYIQTRPQVIV